MLKKGEYIAIKCDTTSGENDSGSYEINLPYYGGGSLDELLVWENKLLKVLDVQSFSMGPQRYTFTERLLTVDAKATFNQAALDVGIHTVYNLNKVLLEMTKQTFSACPFHEQKNVLT